MDSALKQITKLIEDHVGGLIDVAEMPQEDKDNLKTHLKAAEDILLRNGNVKLREVVGTLASSILGRLGG